ncbi:serine protease [Dinoroseobacter sp. S375]|uniref:serine protease n=1 Tax=Dinoroseobacter sp. S375 TaxID=3415136 RepID=UPI003C7CAE5E
MRTGLVIAVLAAMWMSLLPGRALAQEQVWIQIEARPTLSAAEDRARAYAGRLNDVAGYRLQSGWYAIALGPYGPDEAAAALSRLRALGDVPNDSFIADGRRYRDAFWPQGQLGQRATTDPLRALEQRGAGIPGEAPVAPVLTVTPSAPPPADETPAQARASERALDRPARERLQEAMQWFGHYTAAIDGAFGPGTRRAMSAYQTALGDAVTGILTSAQRARLLADWQADLNTLGMAPVVSAETGIALDMPLGMVRFDRLEPPFAHYEGDGARKALLISQEGSPAGLAGLYEIMQTLEVIPREGARSRGERSFEIRGANAEIASYTYAALEDGAIKGFTLVWPLEDARLMERAAQMMRSSFTAREGIVLDPAAGDPEAEQRIDLLSGLEIRQPLRAVSGFFITAAGDVLTTDTALRACGRVTIGDEIEADIRLADAGLGLAVLSPRERVAPMSVARFRDGEARLQSEIAVSGYSYAGLLGAPTLSFGTVADLRGLQGEAELDRLAVEVAPGDAGGPVLDTRGDVLGLLLPRPEAGSRVLPGDVHFATDAAAIAGWLGEAGVEIALGDAGPSLPPERLAMLAGNLTVLVSCWE